jgi:hypothetical protein
MIGRNEENIESHISEFCNASRRLNEVLGNYGFLQRRFTDPALSHLSRLSFCKREEVLKTTRLFERIAAEALVDQVDLWNTSNLMKLTFRELKLQYSQDFLSTIELDDVVDGYDLNNHQIFRNLRFMEICSYDLHDVLSFDWPILFERSQVVTNQIMECVTEVIETGRTVSMDHIPAHYMKEHRSTDRQLFRVKFRHMGPIFAGVGRPAGFLASSKAELIETPVCDLRFI